MSDPSNKGHAKPEAPESGKHLTEGVCRALLNDLLSSAEKKIVLTHISSCQRCETAFKDRVAERERLRSSFALRHGSAGDLSISRLQAQSDERRSSVRVIESLRSLWDYMQEGTRRLRIGYALGAVAVAALLLILLWPDRDGGEDASLRWLPVTPGGLQVRDAEETVESEAVAAGMAAYANREVETAIDLLRETSASGRLETLRRIYLASALAQTERYSEAARLLKSVRPQTLPDPWGSESLWTLYVSLRESGQQTAADSLLRLLCLERGEVGDRARRVQRR